MIIPSQHASRVARAAAGGGGGGGGDVTPNAVNWANVNNVQAFSGVTEMLQITGITETITLQVAHSGNSNSTKYYLNSSNSHGTGTEIANNGTFTVSNNQYVGFGASSPSAGGNRSFTITNVSDANAVLDTFTITYSFEEE